MSSTFHQSKAPPDFLIPRIVLHSVDIRALMHSYIKIILHFYVNSLLLVSSIYFAFLPSKE